MTCILCKSSDGAYTTKEHVIPESLGGGDEVLLPMGLVCDQCQNYFGTKIEQSVLGDAPFHLIRTLLSLPTKKGRAPWFADPLEGRLEATGLPNQMFYDPPEQMREATDEGAKTQMRFSVRPRNPRLVCRFLLKMGIEVLAAHGKEVALLPKYDAARAFARSAAPGSSWWYIELTPEDAMRRWLTIAQDLNEGEALAKAAIEEPEPGLEIFVFRLGPAVFMLPLVQNVLPAAEWAQNSAESRTYHV